MPLKLGFQFLPSHQRNGLSCRNPLVRFRVWRSGLSIPGNAKFPTENWAPGACSAPSASQAPSGRSQCQDRRCGQQGLGDLGCGHQTTRKSGGCKLETCALARNAGRGSCKALRELVSSPRKLASGAISGFVGSSKRPLCKVNTAPLVARLMGSTRHDPMGCFYTMPENRKNNVDSSGPLLSC